MDDDLTGVKAATVTVEKALIVKNDNLEINILFER